ncbi:MULTISPECIES: hypothetical protein [unclassified Pseudomonas]|uniref:hypothetical protein n=1 Tax=unclassified Pseudomonas TaxID=196821 RepID=UPI000F561F68|nr:MULTISPECIES: hypothetical protein [unclassified Pseudomonas]AZF15564.1 hypothetical protein C4J92_2080 [Pseudomonas sp. R3-18-08]AZF52517.1 hypothetical protein C4J85_2032 [Pseudomonas sp. R4-34-07]
MEFGKRKKRLTDAISVVPHLKKEQKKRPVKVAFFRFKEFKGLEAKYGAADGTITHPPNS